VGSPPEGTTNDRSLQCGVNCNALLGSVQKWPDKPDDASRKDRGDVASDFEQVTALANGAAGGGRRSQPDDGNDPGGRYRDRRDVVGKTGVTGIRERGDKGDQASETGQNGGDDWKT